MYNADKAILRGNFIILNVYVRKKKKRKSQINDLSIYHKKLKKKNKRKMKPNLDKVRKQSCMIKR